MPLVTMPDGTPVNFPDDMPHEQIKGLIASKFPEVNTSPNLSSRISMDANNRLQQANQKIDATENPDIGTAARVGINYLAGSTNDAVKELGNSVNGLIPQSAKDIFAASPLGVEQQIGSDMLSPALSYLNEQYTNFSKAHPITSDYLNAVGNVAQTAGNVGAAASGVKALSSLEAPGAIGKFQANKSSGLQLPFGEPNATSVSPEMRAMAPLVKAEKGTTMGRTMLIDKPNPVDIGLDANKAISQQYAVAKDTVNAAEDWARSHAVDIPAGDFKPRIDGYISYLEGKGFPDTVDKLKEIKATLESGSVRDPATGSVTTPRINASELIDLNKTINSEMSNNKFLSSSDGKVLNLKEFSKNLLGRASEASPEFADSYSQYQQASQDIARRFTGNKSLKPFWQPEDYTAWKANQNNPSAPSFGDQTLSRASELLKNLNTDKTGRVRALINTLPPDVRDRVLQAAIITAKKNQPGIVNSLIRLKSGNPIGAIESLASKPTPLLDTLNNLKDMGVQ